jgi:ubiquinone/menaquinone biosynthesis C-methylase UbiE
MIGLDNFVDINWLKNTPIISIILNIFGITIALYGTFMGSYMTYCSRIGKLKTRDFLLDEISKYLKWDEVKQSLDIGCGKGLLLIGAAKRLSNGISLGIDIWSADDQSNNSQSATIENAALAGVSDKIQVQTADARNLPFENDAIDLVMSHWVVHNIESETEQIKCLDEMYRVVKPGGAIILADIQNVTKYIQHFQILGASEIEFNDGGFEAKIMSILSGGTYVPQSLICVKTK